MHRRDLIGACVVLLVLIFAVADHMLDARRPLYAEGK
jgi:hypothetical protein